MIYPCSNLIEMYQVEMEYPRLPHDTHWLIATYSQNGIAFSRYVFYKTTLWAIKEYFALGCLIENALRTINLVS